MTSLNARASNRFRSGSSLTAVAAIGAVAAPTIAEAQIVYSGVLDTTTSGGTTMTLEFQGTPANGSELVLDILVRKGTRMPVRVDDFGDTAVDFSGATFGETIDASGTFTTPSTPAFLSNNLDASYYYGFSYSSVGGTLYGWFHYSVADNGNNGLMTLHAWAYNSIADQSITVGQTTSAVPEPATYGALMGLAVLGAVWLRRRRRPAHTP
jgi:hypothetical protein